MNTIFLVLFKPKKAFQTLKIETNFSYINLFIILFLVVINFILMLPISSKIMNITTSEMFLTEEQKDATIRIFHKLKYVQVAGVIITYVIKLFVSTLILYILLFLAKTKMNYNKLLELIIYCSIIIVLGNLINTVLIYVKGIESIQNIYDTYLTGLNIFLFNSGSNSSIYSVLVNVSVFKVYFVILLSVGLKTLLEISLKKSIAISLMFWVITMLPSITSIYFADLLN